MGPDHNREVPQLYSSLITPLGVTMRVHTGKVNQMDAIRCVAHWLSEHCTPRLYWDKNASKQANIHTVSAAMG